MSRVKDFILHDIDNSFKKVERAIENMDQLQWGQVFNRWSYAKTLYHIIETYEFYIYDGPEGFRFGSELGVDLKVLPENEVHWITGNKDKEFYKNFLKRVTSLVNNRLSEFSEDQLLENDKFGEWGFHNRLHKLSYVVQHSMMHLGEINKTLRDLEKDTIKW
ncbi:MAG: DinB family protein [Candidatus Kariarchaeaceae archaeon]|jgi:hypothetical protein